MSEIKLGQLIEGEQFKDAIHIAVAPMVATCKLSPGQDVGIVGAGEAGPSKRLIGIVDPFLQKQVYEGQRFWLFLYPNTVTGMRHEWQHPAFGEEPEPDLQSKKAIAKQWIQAQCEELGVSFESLVDDDSEGLTAGEYIRSHLNESARDHWYNIADDFWKYHEEYTGRKTEENSRGGFTCSC